MIFLKLKHVMSFSCLKCSNCFPQHIEETQNLYHDLKGRTRITTFYHLLLFPVFQFCTNNSGLYFVPQNIRLVSVSSFCICYFLFLEGSPSSSHSSYLLSGLNVTIASPGFSDGSAVKNLPRNAGDAGLIPGLERSLREGNGNPLQYSCLGNPMDKGAWWATVHGVTKESDTI